MARKNPTKRIALLLAAGLLSGAVALCADAPKNAPAATEAKEPAGPTATVILNEGSYWRYFVTARKPVYRKDQQLTTMRYSNVDSALPPAAWATPDFDDQFWMNRRGPFFPTGHGWAWVKEADNKGYIGYDGTSECMALLCARGKFQVTDPKSVGDLTLSLTYRGGVVVYLNGQEVARGNLPDPEKKGLEALAEDYPLEACGTENGKPIGIGQDAQKNKDRLEMRLRKLSDIKVPAASLRAGVNTLAVEVHRAAYSEFILRNQGSHAVQQFDWLPMGLVSLELKTAGTGATPNVARPKGLQAWSQSPASRIGVDQYACPLEKGNPVRIFGARNGTFVTEVIVSDGAPIQGVQVACSALAGPSALPADAISVRYGGPDKDAFSGPYDVLSPTAPQKVAADKNTGGAVQPVVLTVRVPKDAKAGLYKGKVTVTAVDATPVELPLELSVADWVMTDARDFQTQMGLYESPESVALQYKVDLWSEENWKLVDKVFAMMAEVGADDVFVPVELKTHLGNSQSMVRWVVKEDGTAAPDFSLVEKYLDLAMKRLGKPANVCFILWDQNNGFTYGGGAPQPATSGFRYTRFDPKTGKTEDAEGPKYGTPEIREFLKPVAEGIRKVVKDRGLESSMMLGILGDCVATKDVFADLETLFPGTKWAWAAHQQSFGAKHLAYETFVYHELVPPEPVDGKRKYGWKADRRWACNRREGLAAHCAPFDYRMVVETRLCCGYMGISRLGADFWPVLGPLRDLGRGTLGRRYPDVDWHQLNFGVAAGSVLSAGKDGPLGTLRFEALRAGCQESEARICIEKALVDPARKAKLGDALARRCQDALDDRQRQLGLFLRSSHFFTGVEWEKNTGELYKLAGEVAQALEK
jgi:hypothetical protein